MASRRSDLRILCSGAIAAALTFAAAGAAAQTPGGQASSGQGLRTLSWPGKAQAPRAEQGASRAAPSQADPAHTATAPESAPPQVQPSVLPDYTAATPAFPRGLTPATAFGAPAVVRGGGAYASAPAAYQPAPAPSAPAPTVQAAMTAPVAPTPVPSTAVPHTPVPQTPLPQTPVASTPAQPATSADDPMAPRADAPIWRMMGSERTDAAQAPVPAEEQGLAAPQPAPQPVDGADRDGARYYSVHRQAGRAPDPTTLPAPFFLDSAPVDLAEPPPPPTLLRQGGLAPSVADTGL